MWFAWDVSSWKEKSSKEKEANGGLGWPRQMVRSKAYGPNIDVLLDQTICIIP